jgi:flagellar hook protein FlgE
MLKSLYSGVSGMKGFQTKMDVIANNIANTNTTAFKSGRARFQDMISQTNANASGPTAAGMGGINPQQVGLGVKVSAIDTIMTGGSLQSTGRDLDFGIEREGFFAVSSIIDIDDEGTITEVGTKYYTRDGAFFRDYEGNLVNSNGERVLGYVMEDYKLAKINPTDTTTIPDFYNAVDTLPDDYLSVPDPTDPTETNTAKLEMLNPLKIPDKIFGVDDDGTVTSDVVDLQSYSIDGTGKIVGVYSDGKAYLLGQIALVKFSNPEGLEKVGNSNYAYSNNSGEPIAGEAGGEGFGTIRQNFLEMSNVDLANEFTEMIIASRAYSANSRSITTSDEMLQELINLKR